MKKVLAMLLVIISVFGAFAIAETVNPIETVRQDDLVNGVLSVGFEAANVTEQGIAAIGVYTEQYYEMNEIENLQPGDTVILAGEEIPVETIENDGFVLVNGGDDAGGITLRAGEGVYCAMSYEAPVYHMTAEIDLPFADEIVYRHFIEEDGTIKEGMTETNVTAAELAKILAEEGHEFFNPNEVSILVHDGAIAEVNIYYAP